MLIIKLSLYNCQKSLIFSDKIDIDIEANKTFTKIKISADKVNKTFIK